jgi:acetate kinase
MKILVLNSGSSSQKSALFDVGAAFPDDPPRPAWQAKIEWNGDHAEAEVRNSFGADLRTRVKVTSHKQALNYLLDTLWSGETRILSGPAEVEMVGHRVAHGGGRYRQPTLITPEVKAAIAQLAIFAPLHNRAELGGMDIIQERFGSVPQVAVFDTAFHSQMPEASAVYPGPYEWLAQGIRRYGFHGINHQYCAERAAHLLAKDLRSLKLVTCHLGNGCSLAAICDGRSMDTTMMGTRSGSLDPGILTYLASIHGLTGERMDELLNTQSGLLGISGLSSDMRRIVDAMKQHHSRAKLAFDIFIHRLQAGIGAMVAVLGGIDALVFSAGIGENSPDVRAAACANLGYLGLRVDPVRNLQSAADGEISVPESTVRVLVVRAQEDWAIARHCRQLAAS